METTIIKVSIPKGIKPYKVKRSIEMLEKLGVSAEANDKGEMFIRLPIEGAIENQLTLAFVLGMSLSANFCKL